jgi:hypothetical protein
VDRFSFFFAFYGLILGLAVTELLGGFAGMARARALRRIEPQTALLALLVFIIICATWIDAWSALRTVTLDFDALWAPIILATLYYLAAAVVFPRNPAEFERLGAYYAERKRFVVAMLLAAEFLVNFTFRHLFEDLFQHRPAVFWLWTVPYNVSIKAGFIGLFFVRDRRANVVLLALLILLFSIPYWENGAIAGAIARHWGY